MSPNVIKRLIPPDHHAGCTAHEMPDAFLLTIQCSLRALQNIAVTGAMRNGLKHTPPVL